jgi:long-chain fatty acid transport protein
LSVFGRVTHETSNGGEASRLAPTDGSTAFGIGGTYTMENIKLTGGIEYVTFGEATDATGTIFADNTALGFGLSVGYSF